MGHDHVSSTNSQAALATDDYEKTLRTAMARLNQRAKSTRQLTEHLRQKGHPELAIGRVTDRLTELGLLNDRHFGEALIRDICARKPAGPRLLRTKLLSHGLDVDLVEQLIKASAASSAGALAQAVRLGRQTRRAKENRPMDIAAIRRLYGQLARRGFDTDTIQAAINELTKDQVASQSGTGPTYDGF